MRFPLSILAVAGLAAWLQGAVAMPAFPGAEGWGTDTPAGRGPYGVGKTVSTFEGRTTGVPAAIMDELQHETPREAALGE